MFNGSWKDRSRHRKRVKTPFFNVLNSESSEPIQNGAHTVKKKMSCSREVEVALRYLQQVISSQSPQLILNSTSAVFDAVSVNCNNKDKRLQAALVQLLRCTDRDCIKANVEPKSQEIRNAVEQLSEAVKSCTSASTNAASGAGVSGTESPPPEYNTGQRTNHKEQDAPDDAESMKSSLEEEQTLDDLLNKLNLRKVPKFSPTFPDLDTGGESDEDYAVTTDERKEEREEKHGQKLCEEEVQKMPDGTEVRYKKTRMVNVQQSRKHVTISSRGAGCPGVTRHFTDGKSAMQEDEEEEESGFFRRDPFERFKRRQARNIDSLELTTPDAGQSTKTKSVERTSEVSQSVSERKERDGRVLRENAAQKLDSSALTARQTDTFQGSHLLDRKGEGSYEESCVVRGGPLALGPQPVLPPRKHVVEYMQTFGKENTDVEFFRGTALSSYITLNDNLRYHEEQFRKKLQFEFSTAGTSRVAPDFANLAELLQDAEFEPFKLPSKWAEEEKEDNHAPRPAIDWLERRAIADVPEIICTLDASEYLVMRTKEDSSKPPEVRGGPRDALIVHATEHNSSVLFQEAFLVTYRTFISSHDLINKLITRYVYMSMSRDRASQSAARLTFSVLVRVVDELTNYELSEALVHTVTSFVYRLIHEGNLIFARLLRKRLLDRIVTPKPPLATVSKLTPPRKPFTLFDFRSSDIACQMTYIDSYLFHLIEPAELLWWAQEQDELKSPNLVAFTEHFNNVSFWVRTLVITPPTVKEREKHMLKFIKIMKQLRRLGNFNSYLALLSALVSSPLARLEWSKTVTDALREHAEVMDTAHSYKNYRVLLQQATPPTVPYIGVVLQDLTFVHAGNADKLPADRCGGRRGLINFLKRWHQYAILDSIRKMKRWNYDITRDEKVLCFFDSFSSFLTEEQTWARSHEIKPTNRKKP